MASETMDRQADILAHVDRLIAVHNEWESDPKLPDVPTEAFENALVAAAQVSENGSIPAGCRDLCTAMSRLRLEWNEYVGGLMDNKHRPIGSFWAAFRGVIKARNGIAIHEPRRPEPVCVLLEQKVSYQQIACHIYGHNGKGPFLTPAGQPDISLILKEAKEPGSVVPEDWVHPAEAEINAVTKEAMSRAVQRLRTIDDDPGTRLDFTPDPASIEQLLKEGQFPQVIARVKGVTLDEVFAEAKRLNIEAAEMPNLAAMRAPHERPAPEGPINAIATEPPKRQRIPEHFDNTDSINQQILALVDQGMGTPEIVAELEGQGVTPQKVAAVVRDRRRQAKATAAEPVAAE